MYADYTYYTTGYFGTLIPDAGSFNRCAKRADLQIDNATMGRARDADGEVLELLKDAECAIAESYYLAETVDSSPTFAVSESVGNHSVTYANTRMTADERRANVRHLLNEYLGATGLLYRGLH